jgi:hypothetical protein
MFYLPGGPMAAIALGMVLFPLRAWTNAANFTFLFLALILVVAELGGRAAAIATAATAALSLDFFLTEPYLSLRIAGRHDLLAFLGLMLCGLVAADLGARSRERLRFLRAARARLQLVHEALLRAGEPPDRWEIAALLRAAREDLPISGLVLRDVGGAVIAGAPEEHAARPLPAVTIEGERLPVGAVDGGVSSPLPSDGLRVSLIASGRQVGWLDVWGTASPPGRKSAVSCRIWALRWRCSSDDDGRGRDQAARRCARRSTRARTASSLNGLLR